MVSSWLEHKTEVSGEKQPPSASEQTIYASSGERCYDPQVRALDHLLTDELRRFSLPTVGSNPTKENLY